MREANALRTMTRREGLRGFCTARNPKQSGGRGAGGRSGAAALYCLKQDWDDMVPVRVQKQTLMLKPPLPTTHFRISPP